MTWEPGGTNADGELYDHFGVYDDGAPAPIDGGAVNPREQEIYRLAYVLNAQGDGLGKS